MPTQDASERRTAFVTGASYGIGAASALALARDGCDVAVSDLRADDLAETVAAIKATGARAVAVGLDVRSLASIERAMAEALATFGHLDVLVNNAGVPLTRAAVDVTEAEWDEVMGVNLARHKVLTFGFSAMLAGIAGSLFVFNTNLVNSDTFGASLLTNTVGEPSSSPSRSHLG